VGEAEQMSQRKANKQELELSYHYGKKTTKFTKTAFRKAP